MYVNPVASDNNNNIPFRRFSHSRRIARRLGLMGADGDIDHLALVVALFTFITASCSFMILFVTGYFYFIDDNPPANNLYVHFTQPEVVVGAKALMHVDLCRYTDAPVTLQLAWVDGVRYLAPAIEPPTLEPGCYENIPVVVDVPMLPAGEYSMDWEFVYHINFLRTRSVIAHTNDVKIIEAP